MHINGTGPNGARRPDPSTGPRPASEVDGAGEAGSSQGRGRGADRVEISAQARALAEAETEGNGLLPQLIVRIRGRLDSGYYDRPDVMAETASRMLRSGDL